MLMTITEIASNPLESKIVLPYAVQHETKTSIQHWQLRDLLVFPSAGRPEYLSVYGTHVYQNNIKTGEKKGILTDLDFSPTCLAGEEDLVVVGGQRSQILVKHTSTGWMKGKNIGGQINNCVALMMGRTGGCGPKVVVGNNDETIRVLSLPDLGTETCIQVGAAVNYLAVSPDQKMLACVGDMNEVYIYDLEDRNKQIFTFKMRDSGFGLSWHPSSTMLAAGSQDGQVHIWDLRTTSTTASSGVKPLASYRSSQTLPKGAIRNVKFSQSGSVDLLAFAEHSSFVGLVDTRLMGCGEGRCEAVRVGPVEMDVNLAGMAFSPQSKSVVVAMEGAALEYKIDLRARHSFPSGSIL